MTLIEHIKPIVAGILGMILVLLVTYLAGRLFGVQ